MTAATATAKVHRKAPLATPTDLVADAVHECPRHPRRDPVTGDR
jgi:hypothetical protein